MDFKNILNKLSTLSEGTNKSVLNESEWSEIFYKGKSIGFANDEAGYTTRKQRATSDFDIDDLPPEQIKKILGHLGLRYMMAGSEVKEGAKDDKAEKQPAKKKSLKDWFEAVDKNTLNEAEQITIQPAKQNTQVIKQGNVTLGTVANPQLAAQIKQSIGKGEMQLAGARLGENFEDDDDFEDDEVEDRTKVFYVVIINDGARFVGEVSKEDGKWHEGSVKGKKPYGWGGKTYQSYMTPKEIMQWYHKDFDSAFGPFASADEAIDHAKSIGGRGLSESKKDYSAKKAAAGKDIGKPGKNFAKIAKSAGERYGSKEKGEKVAGAVLAKLRGLKEAERPSDDSDMGAGLGAGRSATTLEGKKPDFLDLDKDGDKKEPMKSAAKSMKKVKESAKPDFLDLDKDGNKKETMKKASKDMKKVKESAKPDFLDLDKDGDKKEPMKSAARNMKKKKVKEGMNHRLHAARLEGKAHGLKGHAYHGKSFEDMEEARMYHEGYKEGLDECYGMSGQVEEGLIGGIGGSIAGGMLGGPLGALAGGMLGSQLGNDEKNEARMPSSVRGMANQEMLEAVSVDANDIWAQESAPGQFKIIAVGDNFADGLSPGDYLDDVELRDLEELGAIVKANVKRQAGDEQLDELRQDTLASYISKAANSLHNNARAGGEFDDEEYADKALKRTQGIKSAAFRLSDKGKRGWLPSRAQGISAYPVMKNMRHNDSEFYEGKLNELSKDTLASYIKKASGKNKGAMGQAYLAAHHLGSGDIPTSRQKLATAQKRVKGIDMAVDKLAKDATFEAWDRELLGLLNESVEKVEEGISVSVSKGQQGSPDSVTVSAQDADAEQLLGLIKNAGLGLFGDDTPAQNHPRDVGAPSGSSEINSPGSIEVVDDHDGMMGLIKKLSGIQQSGDEDYADEGDEEGCGCESCGMQEAECSCDQEKVDEFLDVTVSQKGGDSGSQSGVSGISATGGKSGATGGTSGATGGTSGAAADADADSSSYAKANESETEDQMAAEVAEDNAPDSGAEDSVADENAEAKEDSALAGADSGDEEELNENPALLGALGRMAAGAAGSMAVNKLADKFSSNKNAQDDEELNEFAPLAALAPLAGAAVRGAAMGAGNIAAGAIADKIGIGEEDELEEGKNFTHQDLIKYADKKFQGWEKSAFKAGDGYSTVQYQHPETGTAMRITTSPDDKQWTNWAIGEINKKTGKFFADESGNDGNDEVKDYIKELLAQVNNYMAENSQVNEWANNAGEKGTDAAYQRDIEFMTKVISGGLNKPKSTGQTTIPVIASQTSRQHSHQTTDINESISDWMKLAGIKK